MKNVLPLSLVAALLLSSCSTPTLAPTPSSASLTSLPSHTVAPPEIAAAAAATSTPRPTSTPIPASPTPDPAHPQDPNLEILGPGWATFSYQVQAGDDLGTLAARYGVSYDQIRAANGFKGGETLLPGQILLIPQLIQEQSPALKLIPDSELVYGPGTAGFDTRTFVARYERGYLFNYTEVVNGEEVTGAELLQRTAQDYSLNPRLLLALLEFQSGWLTKPDPGTNARLYPFGRAEGGTEGLYRQLAWAANALNHGFYEWRADSLSLLILGDGTRIGLSDGVNAGTVSLQYFFSLTTTDFDSWESAVNATGISKTYATFFGYPFANSIEPLIPSALTQLELGLPWQSGETWFYSGGPHSSFGSGSPWGAVDFLPPGNEAGCAISPNWITAVAAGLVVRSESGQVLLDLDQDGFEQTGWAILYLHIAEQDRVAARTRVERGDPIGHASCEGGFAKDAHVHLARKYNGVWLAANDPLAPFVLGGYTFKSTGSEYNGLIEGFGVARLACACRNSSNAVNK